MSRSDIEINHRKRSLIFRQIIRKMRSFIAQCYCARNAVTSSEFGARGRWGGRRETLRENGETKTYTARIEHEQTVFSRSYCGLLLHAVRSAIVMMLSSVCPSVSPSVSDTVHCGAQGRCRRLKVVPLCSYDGTSYSLLQTLLLQDISFSHKA